MVFYNYFLEVEWVDKKCGVKYYHPLKMGKGTSKPSWFDEIITKAIFLEMATQTPIETHRLPFVQTFRVYVSL